jgi:hypothetical protein
MAGVALLLDKLDVAEREIAWMTLEMSESPTTHAFSGILTLLQGGTCAEATPALEKALRSAPEHVWARYGAALCSAQEGNTEAALADLEFVISHVKTPAILRVRAEDLYNKLSDKSPPDEGEEPPDDAILEEFDDLLRLAGDIEDDDLRQQFEKSVDEARQAWKEGDKEQSIKLVEETNAWVQEHEDALGDALARVLTFRLKRIIRLAG